MSFLTSRVSTIAYRSFNPATVSRFSTSVRTQKSAVDATKDAVKTVDRTVSDAAVKGIDAGENVANKAKEAIGVGKGEAKGKAAELAGEAKGKAAELKGEVKNKMS